MSSTHVKLNYSHLKHTLSGDANMTLLTIIIIFITAIRSHLGCYNTLYIQCIDFTQQYKIHELRSWWIQPHIPEFPPVWGVGHTSGTGCYEWMMLSSIWWGYSVLLRWSSLPRACADHGGAVLDLGRGYMCARLEWPLCLSPVGL